MKTDSDRYLELSHADGNIIIDFTELSFIRCSIRKDSRLDEGQSPYAVLMNFKGNEHSQEFGFNTATEMMRFYNKIIQTLADSQRNAKLKINI
ncbi:MAG: hypothetical protein Q4F74_00070 [Synergistaceae bacterium]|nr:hypothetical protein [Synergistaceae bacterium]